MKNSDNAQRLRNAQNELKKAVDALRFKADPEILDIMDDVWRDMDIVAIELEMKGDK